MSLLGGFVDTGLHLEGQIPKNHSKGTKKGKNLKLL